MYRLFPCSLLAGLVGCSLVYDFGRFEGSEQDAAPDVNPADLALREVLSDPLVEGTGCLPVAEPVIEQAAGEGTVTACAPESSTVAVLIEGEDILSDATVRLTGLGFSNDPVEATVSNDGTMIAFEIPVPVDRSLGAGESSTLSVTVDQVAADPQTIDVEVTHLDELVASSFGDPADAVSALAAGELHSTITVDAELDLLGASPFHLRATSLISIEQPLRARGGNRIRRAGGCLGGAAASAGGCGTLGGGAGTGDGGGGGGNQNEGGDGGGGTQNGGAPTPSGFLVPLAEHTGRGGGGANGVVGGDGGGLIAMTSAGRIEIAAAVDVGGGGGENTAGVACNLLGGPGGGGGAGGSILLRARESVVFAGTGSMSLAAGPGGTGSSADCAGGNGSVGRLRIDTPATTGALGDVIAEPEVSPVTGALIAPQSLVRTGPAEQVIALSGDTSNSPVTWISVNDEVDQFNFDTERTVTLVAGVNEVCVHVTDPSQGEPEESRQCVDIVYLP